MNKKDLAMYDAFQRLLHEDGHLKRTDIFAFRLGWLECQAAQQSVQLTVMLGEKAAAKAILQAEEAAQQTFAPDVCHGTADGRHLWQNDSNGRYCFACGTRR